MIKAVGRDWVFGSIRKWVYILRWNITDEDCEKVETYDLTLAGITEALSGHEVSAADWQAIVEGCKEFGMQCSDDELLQAAKDNVVSLITAYDVSENVNQFTFGGIPMWIDRADRAALKNRFESELAAGLTETTLWYGLIAIPISDINSVLQMLAALEVYASRCFDKTAEHKAAVLALESLDDVLSYDYTAGYPDKLEF